MKKKLVRGDYVRLPERYRTKCEYGIVKKKNKDGTVVVAPVQFGEYYTVSADELTYMPASELSDATLAKFIRYELTADDYAAMVLPAGNWKRDVPDYEVSLADVTAMLENLRGRQPDDDALRAWAKAVGDDLCMLCSIDGEPMDVAAIPYAPDEIFLDDDSFKYLADYRPDNEAVVVAAVTALILRCAGEGDMPHISYAQILGDIDAFAHGGGIHIGLWSDLHRREAMQYVGTADYDTFTPEELGDIRDFVTAAAKADSPEALEMTAYACYGGDRFFPCDWERSRDCLLRLMQLEGVDDEKKCGYANTLGYIYYYGRCTDGVPQYDKAFEYFSLGAAGGMYESMYKLADMYRNGYYVGKNTHAALILTQMVFGENSKLFVGGTFDCKFADAALRMGNLCRDGIVDGDEYAYYTIADYALQKREQFDRYGDDSVRKRLEKELKRIRESRPLQNEPSLHGREASSVFERLFSDYICRVTLTPQKTGVKITVKRLPHAQQEEPDGVICCVPDIGYCELLSEAAITVSGVEAPQIDKQVSLIADYFSDTVIDGAYYCIFMFNREPIFALKGKNVTRRLPRKKKA